MSTAGREMGALGNTANGHRAMNSQHSMQRDKELMGVVRKAPHRGTAAAKKMRSLPSPASILPPAVTCASCFPKEELQLL